MTVDANKMEQFLGKFVNDLGAAVHGVSPHQLDAPLSTGHCGTGSQWR